jgi:hypothetical protein
MIHARLLLLLAPFLAALCAASVPYAKTSDMADLQLQQVQIVFRHGDRTPLAVLPGHLAPAQTWTCDSFEVAESVPLESDPSFSFQRFFINGLNFLPGTCSTGQLTMLGAKQHYELGSQFRQRYVDTLQFLPAEFDPSTIKIRSTDVYRTRLSVQSQLHGLYPPSTRSSVNLPIYTVDPGTEYFYPNTDACPNLKPLLQATQNTPEYHAFEAAMEPTLEQLENILGVSAAEMPSWTSLYDIVTAAQAHNQTLPQGFDDALIAKINYAANFIMNVSFSTDKIRRLGMGRVVADLKQNFLDAIQGRPTTKYNLFSAHDTTVGPLVIALGVWDGVWPPYASHLELELWRSASSGAYFVHGSYNGKDVVFPTCGGQAVCPWEQFVQTTDSLIMSDWRAECGLAEGMKAPKKLSDLKRLIRTQFG